MKYSQTKQLSSTKFKRLTGVNRKTYRLMVRIVKAKKALHKKSGRPPELIVEDQVLMVLQYWREYRTYFHIGQDGRNRRFGLRSNLIAGIYNYELSLKA